MTVPHRFHPSPMHRSILLAVVSLLSCTGMAGAIALPPPDDPPEEVLRTEIITEARSPVDGERLTAAEYAELEEQLQTSDRPPTLDPRVRRIIFLLQLRRTLQILTPF